MRLIAILAVILLCQTAEARGRNGHAALVAQSGIRPKQVGTAEGVGMSTHSYIDARNHACYWGKKVPLSVQYSYRNGRYYAVVRYK